MPKVIKSLPVSLPSIVRTRQQLSGEVRHWTIRVHLQMTDTVVVCGLSPSARRIERRRDDLDSDTVVNQAAIVAGSQRCDYQCIVIISFLPCTWFIYITLTV